MQVVENLGLVTKVQIKTAYFQEGPKQNGLFPTGTKMA